MGTAQQFYFRAGDEIVTTIQKYLKYQHFTTHTHHLDRAGPKGGNLACGLGKGLERVACEGRLPSHALEAKRPTRIIPLPSTQANSPARIAKRSRSLETRC